MISIVVLFQKRDVFCAKGVAFRLKNGANLKDFLWKAKDVAIIVA
jgi:hypothetical protein